MGYSLRQKQLAYARQPKILNLLRLNESHGSAIGENIIASAVSRKK
jgi:hypothetical protein